MANSIISTAQSAVASAQINITTTAHNIANAATPGYSRQQVVQVSATPSENGYGFLGQGTDVQTVKRVFDSLLAKQVINGQANKSESLSYQNNMEQINNLLSDQKTGISKYMQDFFNSVQTLNANPTDTPSRQALLSTASSMVSRFQTIDNRLSEMQENVNSQIKPSLDLINAYGKQIGQLNNLIKKALNGTGYPPNDMMDQRDQIVRDLSKQVKTSVIEADDGTYSVYVGKGLSLVLGTDVNSFQTTSSANDTSRMEVSMVSSEGINTSISYDNLPGGQLGGLLKFRAESLDGLQNKFGRIALAFASSFNTQHKLGYDKSGTLGENFFTVTDSLGQWPSIQKTGSTPLLPVVTVANPTALTTSDYVMTGTENGYTITRLSDNSTTTLASKSEPTTLDGLVFTPPADINSTTKFTIKPTANVAANIKVAITNVNKIAMGLTTEPGDNRNGLLLAGLATTSIIDDASSTFTDAYAAMVSEVGNKTRELQINAQADTMVLQHALNAMESESGVNLDEEAANLMRYQQLYQASAKMMTIANDIFKSLLQISGG
jgi:flagellar hook-associated protein 1 FlgK